MTLPAELEATQALASIAAVVIGGAWVYYNTFRGRTYRPRLQVRLAVAPHRVGTLRLLRAQIALENKGLSQVTFTREGTGLELWYAQRLEEFPEPVLLTFHEHSTYSILRHHESIEPGLAISEEVLIQLPERAADACELRLRVVAHRMSWSSSASIASFTATTDTRG